MNSSFYKYINTSLIFRHVTFGLHNANITSNTCRYSTKIRSNQLKLWKAMFKNPVLDLQQYLDIPLIKKEDVFFDPTAESMQTAFQLFRPRENNIINKIVQTVNPESFPSHTLPEIAFLGQSNAGKSSILSAIFIESPELGIQTSKNPGHTKSLKFYGVGTHLCLVDMPGYGLHQPKWFEASVIPYLKTRRNLVKTFLLIDSAKNFHSWDDASLQMLNDLGAPFAVVLTKIDLVPDSQRLKNYLFINNIIKKIKINTCFPQVFMLSAHTCEGLAYFLSFCAHITGNLNTRNM